MLSDLTVQEAPAILFCIQLTIVDLVGLVLLGLEEVPKVRASQICKIEHSLN